MRCGVGHRSGLDLALLWLWCRPAAVAPIGPLAWEPPYATEYGLKDKKTQKKKKKKKKKRSEVSAGCLPSMSAHIAVKMAVGKQLVTHGKAKLSPYLPRLRGTLHLKLTLVY